MLRWPLWRRAAPDTLRILRRQLLEAPLAQMPAIKGDAGRWGYAAGCEHIAQHIHGALPTSGGGQLVAVETAAYGCSRGRQAAIDDAPRMRRGVLERSVKASPSCSSDAARNTICRRRPYMPVHRLLLLLTLGPVW